VTHLLDTDVAVGILRLDPAMRLRLESVGVVAISSITLMELACGVWRSSRPESNGAAVERLLDFVGVLDFDTAAARGSGSVRAQLAAEGRPIGAYDALIAGHAMAEGLVLATRNVREFSRVDGLAVEDWGTSAT
jgi:tRNA(fMet)-specific endonuclease VapC